MELNALPPQLHWVLTAAQKGIKNREPAIQETVRKLRLEFPAATDGELARTLIGRTRRRLAMTAAASGAAAIVPGLGTLGVIGVGTVQSMYALEQELELVLAVGLIFGHLPVEHDDRTLEALVVVGIAGGAVKLRDDLLIAGSQRLAVHLVTTYPPLLLSRVGQRSPHPHPHRRHRIRGGRGAGTRAAGGGRYHGRRRLRLDHGDRAGQRRAPLLRA